MTHEKRKIVFRIPQDSEGYPPFSVETMWGVSTDVASQFVIDNIPFFATQATLGDVVTVVSTSEGIEYDSTVEESGNSLIRVAAFKEDMVPQIRKELRDLGCSSEEFKGRPLIAVNVPGNANLSWVQNYLE